MQLIYNSCELFVHFIRSAKDLVLDHCILSTGIVFFLFCRKTHSLAWCEVLANLVSLTLNCLLTLRSLEGGCRAQRALLSSQRLGRTPPAGLGAHSTRSIASSAALFRGVSTENVYLASLKKTLTYHTRTHINFTFKTELTRLQAVWSSHCSCFLSQRTLLQRYCRVPRS